MKKKTLRLISGALAALMTFETFGVSHAQANFLSRPPALESSVSKEISSKNLNPAHVPGTASSRFSVPAAMGSIGDVVTLGQNARMIYHIQDVHDQVPAQVNVSGIVSLLEKHAAQKGKSLVVLIEGASGAIDLSPIHAVSDMQSKETLASALLRGGFLFGEEYAAMTREAGRIALVGVETPSLYKKNTEAAAASEEARTNVLSIFNQIRKQMEQLKAHNFNATLVELETKRLQVESGALSAVDYLSFLNRINPAVLKNYPDIARLINVSRRETDVDFNAVDKESRELVAELMQSRSDEDVRRMVEEAQALKAGAVSPLSYYSKLLSSAKKDYPMIKAYIVYLKEAEGINADGLFDQILDAEIKVAHGLIRHPVSFELYKHLRWIELQEKFFSLKMVPQEWEKQQSTGVRDIQGHHNAILQFVAEQVGDLGYRFSTPSLPSGDLTIAVQGASIYYKAAVARNAAMVANIKKALKDYPADKFETAYIAGGFHTPGVTKLFREQGFGYTIVRPQLETEIELDTTLRVPAYDKLTEPQGPDFLRMIALLGANGGADLVARFRALDLGEQQKVLDQLIARAQADADFAHNPSAIATVVVKALGVEPAVASSLAGTNGGRRPSGRAAFTRVQALGVIAVLAIVIGRVFIGAADQVAQQATSAEKISALLNFIIADIPSQTIVGALLGLAIGFVIVRIAKYFGLTEFGAMRVFLGGDVVRNEAAATVVQPQPKEMTEEELAQLQADIKARIKANNKDATDTDADDDSYYSLALLQQALPGSAARTPLNIPNPPASVQGGGTVRPGYFPPQAEGNFVPNSWLSPEDEASLGIIDYERDVKGKTSVDSQNSLNDVTVLVNDLNAGKGENNVRDGFIRRRLGIGQGQPVTLGAKGTDIGEENVTVRSYNAAGQPVDVVVPFISDTELKIIGLIYERLQHETHARVIYEAIVNAGSRESLNKILDSVSLIYRVDGRPNIEKPTYREELARLFNVSVEDLQSFIDQANLPYFDKTNYRPASDSKAAGVGGHGQIGNRLSRDALRRANERDGQKPAERTVRFFTNGDNTNGQVDRDTLLYVLKKKLAVVILATDAEPNDVKIGEFGLKYSVQPRFPALIAFFKALGFGVPGFLYKKVAVAEMLEYGEPKGNGKTQLDRFVQSGRGIGRSGAQLANTNLIYINVDVLGDILRALQEIIKQDKKIDQNVVRLNFELSKYLVPNIVPKTKTIDGVEYVVLDGPIASGFMKLNEAFVTNPRLFKILQARGLERIVSILRVPRSYFVPNKFPSDAWLYHNTTRYEINTEAGSTVDIKPERPQPKIEIVQDPANRTEDYNTNAGEWKDYETLVSHLGAYISPRGFVMKPNTDLLDELIINGLPFKAQGATYEGRVWIYNERPGFSFLSLDRPLPVFKNEFVHVKPDGTVVRLPFNGGYDVVPEAGNGVQQPLHVAVLPVIGGLLTVLSVFLFAAVGNATVWGSAANIIAILSAVFGTVAATAGTLAIFLIAGKQLDLKGESTVALNDVAANPQNYPDANSRNVEFAQRLVAALEKIPFIGRAIPVFLQQGRLGDTNGRTLLLASGYFVNDTKGGLFRREFLRLTLAHEAGHLLAPQFKSNNVFAFVANEFIAWAFTIFFYGYLLTVSSRESKASQEGDLLARTLVDTNAPTAGAAVDAFALRHRSKTSSLPKIVAVDLAEAYEAGVSPVEYARQAVRSAGATFEHALRNGVNPNTTIVITNTNPANTDAEAAVQAVLPTLMKETRKDGANLTITLMPNAELGDLSSASLPEILEGKFADALKNVQPENVFLFSNAVIPSEKGYQTVGYTNPIELGVKLAIYSSYTGPQGMAMELLRLLSVRVKRDLLRPLDPNDWENLANAIMA